MGTEKFDRRPGREPFCWMGYTKKVARAPEKAKKMILVVLELTKCSKPNAQPLHHGYHMSGSGT